MNKRVLLLNASFNDEGMLKALKKLGCYVITTGNRPDLIGHKLADEYICGDYTDIDYMLKIAIDKNVDAICPCANDHGVRIAAYISEKLGFKGQDSYENATIIHDKDKFKEFAKKNPNIKTPLATYFSSIDEAILWGKKQKKYPLIVKASDLCGGLGIEKVNNYIELENSVEKSFNLSKNKRILIEPYIEGTLHGLCTYIINKKVVLFCSDSEYCIINPYKVEMYNIPGNYIEEVKNDLIEQIEYIADRLELNDGIFHLQYIYKNGEAYIIECMRRVLGNMYGLIANKYNNFDWDYWQVKAICGFGIDDFPKNTFQKGYYAFKAMLAGKDGWFEKENIDDELKKKVIYSRKLHKVGDYISDYGSNPISLNFFKFNSKEETNYLLIDKYKNSNVEIK